MSGEHYNNYSGAANLVNRELLEFREGKPDDYFHPCNRDIWMDAFIDWLRKRYQQPGRIASND